MRVPTKLKSALLAAAVFIAMTGGSFAQGSKDLTIVVAAEPQELDPCSAGGGESTGVILGENVVQTLTLINPNDGTIMPQLATSWEQTNESTWRFHLREGVKFHDGTPFTADAIAKALARLQSKDLICRGAWVKVRPQDPKVTVIDDLTVDLSMPNLALPVPAFMSLVGIGAPTTPPTLDRDPVGTGPFAFTSWEPGKEVVITRFADYWGAKPEPDKVTYVWRSETALRAKMVETGEADIAFPIAPQDATNPNTDQAFLDGETTRVRMVFQPPLDDIRVRKAMNYAFDRQSMIGTVLGEGTQIASQLYLPKVNGYNPDLKNLPWFTYNRDEAKKLIAEAKADGVPVDKPIDLIAFPTYFPNVQEVSQVLAQTWNDIGMNVQVKMMERALYLKMANKPYNPDRPAMLLLESHDNNDGDAVFSMRYKYHSGGLHSELNNPDIDSMIETAEKASGDERTRLWRELNWKIYNEIVPDVPMFNMVKQIRIGPRIDFKFPAFYSGARFDISGIKFKPGA
jgi:peptide/nickel transport system substrate-binding protein